MSFLGRVKDRLLRRQTIVEEIKEDPDFVPANRELRRAYKRAQRLHGPGYTRQMRKGRRVERERPS